MRKLVLFLTVALWSSMSVLLWSQDSGTPISTISLRSKPGVDIVAKFIGTTTKLQVDWGDGKPVALTVSDEIPNDLADVKSFNISVPVENPTIKIYGDGLQMLQLSRFYLGENDKSATMEQIDVSTLPDLEVLIVDNTNLSQLDVSHNPKLRILHAFGNMSLSQLNLKNNAALEELYIQYTRIASLDLSQQSHLRTLVMERSQLTSLDLTSCPQLVTVIGEQTPLTSVDVTGCSLLNDLRIGNNMLTSLTLGGNSNLAKLQVYNNPLSQAPAFAEAPNLEELFFDHTPLSEVDLSSHSRLKVLGAEECKLTKLKIHREAPIEKFSIYGNLLDACALDTLFDALRPTPVPVYLLVQAGATLSNPGLSTSKTVIASNKGYIVYDDITRKTVSGDGTGCKNDLSIAQLPSRSDKQFAVFPSRTSGTLFLQGVGIARLFVLNMNGATLAEYAGNRSTIDVSSLTSGSYVLLVEPVCGNPEVHIFTKE